VCVCKSPQKAISTSIHNCFLARKRWVLIYHICNSVCTLCVQTITTITIFNHNTTARNHRTQSSRTTITITCGVYSCLLVKCLLVPCLLVSCLLVTCLLVYLFTCFGVYLFTYYLLRVYLPSSPLHQSHETLDFTLLPWTCMTKGTRTSPTPTWY